MDRTLSACLQYIPLRIVFCHVFMWIQLRFCQTPDLGQGLEFDFTFANNKKNNENNDKNNDNKNNNNPHLNFIGWDGTRSEIWYTDLGKG